MMQSPAFKSAKKKAEDQVKKLTSALGNLRSSTDKKLTKKDRQAAGAKWREELRAMGKNNLVDAIDKQADGMIFDSYDSPETLSILEKQLQQAQSVLDQFEAGSPSLTSGPSTVMIEAPDGSRQSVPASKVDYYISKGGKVVE